VLNYPAFFRILPALLLGAPAAFGDALRIEPERITLAGPGSAVRLLVTRTSSGGGADDVTAACSLRSLTPTVAAVDAGRLIARAPGEAKVEAACGADTASTTVRVGEQAAADMGVDFSRDLLSIFTTKGCNGSGCHGSPAGQNGFKLSLYAADPAADHAAIVQADDGRRVNLAAPAESLILQKPSFQIAHGGGQLMTPESDEYRTILQWIEQGAPLRSDGAQLERLEIYPRERILVGAGAEQPLVVVGRLSDGTTREMTEQVHFSVDDEAIVSSVEDGAVTARSRGRTSVFARAMGKTAAAQFFVIESAPEPGPALETANFIDAQVFSKLSRIGIRPFPPSSDRVFVRRVFLDAIGVLPTPEEVESFVADAAPDKRSRLIDDLLERDEYATHWLVKFEDWFRNSQYYSQGRTNGSYKRWLHELIRQDRPYDEAVHEMLTAVGDTTVRPAGNFWHPAIDFMLKEFQRNKAVPTIARLFLGKRIECAECHNHPLENLTQDDFYGMAAFLARTDVKHGYGQYRRVWYDTRSGEIEHPVTGKPVPPKYLEGEVAEIAPGQTRREALADWVVSDQRLQLARATVNRVWYEYFGRGIVEPFDDFRSTNPPTHPELLDSLAQHFIDSDFRFKALHRLILNSKTYQLSAHTPDRPGGEDPLEDLLFARYRPRKLPAEVLLDAIVQVTGVPEDFRSYPEGTSAKELIASIGSTHFLRTFGAPQRDVMEPRSQNPSLAQALHLMNSDTVAEKTASDDGRLARLILAGESDDQILEEFYLRAYARPPSAEERKKLEAYLAAEDAAGRDRRRALENALWAVLNAKEFQMNR